MRPLKNLSALYSNTNRHAQAEPYARQLLDLQRASLPPGDLQLADSMVNVAFHCSEQRTLSASPSTFCAKHFRFPQRHLGVPRTRSREPILVRLLLELQKDE